MFIIKTELKLYLNKSVLALVALVALLSVIAGLTGDFLRKDKILPQFTLYVSDNDESAQSKLLCASLKSFKPDVMKVVFSDDATAQIAVKTAEASAALIIPKKFFADIMLGQNSNAGLIINNESPMVSEIITLFSNSLKEQLAAAQAGVYAVLSKASDATYTKYMNESNIIYLSAFMSRSMESEVIQPFKNLSNEQYFAFCFYMLLMFLTPCLFIDKALVLSSVMPVLLAKGVRLAPVFRCLSICIIYAILNAPILAAFRVFLGMTLSFWLMLALIMSQSAFCFLCITLFNDVKQAGVFVFLFQFCMAFFSGGIVPLVFLPESIRHISFFTPNYYLLQMFVADEKSLMVIGFIAATLIFSIALIRHR